MLLCFALYFLAENGKINAFASYLLAIAVIASLFIEELRLEYLSANIPTVVAVAVFTCYLGVSAAWSDDNDIGKHLGYAVLILAFIAGTYLACRRYPGFLLLLTRVIVLAACLSAAISAYLHFAFPDYQPLPEPRLYGLGRLSNPVISATSYGFAVIISCWLLIGSRLLYERIVLATAILVFMLCIVLSGSRTVWLALAVSLGTVLALRRDRHGWIVFLATGAVLAGIMVAVLGIDELTRRALSFRPEIWTEFVSRTIDANILLGLGSGNDSHWQMPELLIQHPHSIFVSSFYFGGLIGLVLLLSLITVCVLQVVKSAPSPLRDLAMLTGLFGLTAGFFDGDNVLTKINYLWWISWFPVTICLLLAAKQETEAA